MDCFPQVRLQENALRNFENAAFKKKSCLSPDDNLDEFFCFSGVLEILAIFMSAAAFLLTFFAGEKSQAQRSEKYFFTLSH